MDIGVYISTALSFLGLFSFICNLNRISARIGVVIATVVLHLTGAIFLGIALGVVLSKEFRAEYMHTAFIFSLFFCLIELLAWIINKVVGEELRAATRSKMFIALGFVCVAAVFFTRIVVLRITPPL